MYGMLGMTYFLGFVSLDEQDRKVATVLEIHPIFKYQREFGPAVLKLYKCLHSSIHAKVMSLNKYFLFFT